MVNKIVNKLNWQYLKKSDFYINFAAIFLALFGLLMITSATMGLDAGNLGLLIKTILKQVVFIVTGLIGMFFLISQFNLKVMKKNIEIIVVVTCVLLVACLAFSSVGGAKAWIRFPGGFTLQPSEFAKITIMLMIAAYFGDIKNYAGTAKEFVKIPFIAIGLMLAIVLILQKDLGSMAVMFAIAIFVFLIPKHRLLTKYQKIAIIIIILGLVGVLFFLTPLMDYFVNILPLKAYQKARIINAKNPFMEKYGSGYQLVNGLVSFASGGLFGVGFGGSIRKYTNFPAANTDFILAIVIEELGFIGFSLIVVGYFLIIFRLYKYAFKMKSEKGRIILLGTAMYILIHFLLNVGGVSGLIPLTGVPLLLISYGGSSTMSILLAIGISQAVISRYRIGEIE